MEIKSKLPIEDFAINVALAREGDTDSLHEIIQSFDFLIKDYRWIRDKVLAENLNASAWEGLIEGICRGLDGRIPSSELYSHLGPYAYTYIKAAISRYWELHDIIRVPESSIREGRAQKIKTVSLDAELPESSGHSTTLGELIPMQEEEEPTYTENEIHYLLSTTAREKKILELLLNGETQETIAVELGLSRSSVAMSLMDIRRRAYRLGLHRVSKS